MVVSIFHFVSPLAIINLFKFCAEVTSQPDLEAIYISNKNNKFSLIWLITFCIIIGYGGDFSKSRVDEIIYNAVLKRNQENTDKPELDTAEMLNRIKFIQCNTGIRLLVLSISLRKNLYKRTKVF